MQSAGVFYVLISTDKYGFRLLSRRIPQNEMERLRSETSNFLCFPEPECSALAIQCHPLRASLHSYLTLHCSAFPYQTLTASSLSPLTKWSNGPAGPTRDRLVQSGPGTQA